MENTPNTVTLEFLSSLKKPHIAPVVETRPSPIAGVGQFALRDLLPGEIIAFEQGPIVDVHTVEALSKQGLSLDTCVGFGQYVLSAPIEHGGEKGIINHSCDPNTALLGDVLWVTIRPVSAGQEITCDYGTFETMRGWSMECNCKSGQCRKTITGKDYLLPDLQRRLGRQFAPYLKRYLHIEHTPDREA